MSFISLQHACQQSVHSIEHPINVGRYHILPIGYASLLRELHADPMPGVGDHDVDAAKRLGQARDRLLNCHAIPNVKRGDAAGFTEFGLERFEAIGTASGCDYLGSRTNEAAACSWTPPKTSWRAPRDHEFGGPDRERGRGMRGQAGFFDIEERLKELSAKGDTLERLSGLVDFELFRPDLERAVPRADRSRGGRPPFEHVLMFKVLILQASHSLSDERTEFLIKDRLSFMRFLGLGLADPVPDANTIWTFREALTRATLGGRPAIEVLFGAYEAALNSGRLPGDGWPDRRRLHHRRPEAAQHECREARHQGRAHPPWADKPAKLAQKDRDARWTVKWSKAKPAEDGSPRMDLAVPAFGYKNHVGIDRRHGLIRTWSVTDAARHDGTQLPTLISKANTGSDVWGDTAYRSRANERLLAENGRRSQIHRKKPPRKPMPKHTARANGARSKVRAAVEHVFAHEKGPMGLVVRTIGLARARVKIGLANLVYNMKRTIWLTGRLAPA